MCKANITFYETDDKHLEYEVCINGISVGQIYDRESDSQYSPRFYFRSKREIRLYASDAHSLIELKRNLINSYQEANGKIYDDYQKPKSDMKELPFDDSEFYPTPKSICGKMIACVNWNKVRTVLEPSAGKGDICDAIKAYKRYDYSQMDIDCIESDINLRFILKGKKYRVVHDDFLSYKTNKKYDLIIMNPPFSHADRHLLNAIEMQECTGGQIVCLLNAETLLNPYTNLRKLLLKKIQENKAVVRYLKSPFKKAERKTDANVALVYFNIPPQIRESEIFSRMKKAKDAEYEGRKQSTELAPNDKIEALIRTYEVETAATIAFLQEYDALRPKIMNGTESYSKPSIGVTIGGSEISDGLTTRAINDYMKIVRHKYWLKLLNIPEIYRRMTTAIHESYFAKIKDMADYEFSMFNIQEVLWDIRAQLQTGVEDEIIRLFDKLSNEHSYYEGNTENIHYYNGWKTNKAHKVNYKVIIPAYGSFASGYVYDKYHKLVERKNDFIDSRSCYSLLSDLEKTLDYLDGHNKGRMRTDLSNRMHFAEARHETRNIDCTYFNVTFYKKGTCHITFRDDAKILIDRLNIYVGKSRNWLPPCYGKKSYRAMTEEEKLVVDSFDGGEENYNRVYENPQNYLIETNDILMLSEGEEIL